MLCKIKHPLMVMAAISFMFAAAVFAAAAMRPAIMLPVSVSAFVLVSLVQGMRYKANQWIFLLVCLLWLPMNLRIISAMIASDYAVLIMNDALLPKLLCGYLFMVIAVRIELLVSALIARFLWPNQAPLRLSLFPKHIK